MFKCVVASNTAEEKAFKNYTNLKSGDLNTHGKVASAKASSIVRKRLLKTLFFYFFKSVVT